MRALYIVLALLAVALGLVGFWLLIPREPSFGMFEEGSATNLLRIGLSFAATIGGVVLGSVYRQMRKLQALGQEVIEDVGGLLTRIGRSLDLWLALAGSPIVFALLLQTTAGMNLSGLLVIALQNGFCCLIIIDQLNPVGDAKPAKPPAGGRP